MTSRRPGVMSTRTRFGGKTGSSLQKKRGLFILAHEDLQTVEAAFTKITQGVCGGDEQTLQQTYFRGSASCVQSFDDSLDIARRMTYRISLRSSSLWEPRHPLLKVLISLIVLQKLGTEVLAFCHRIFVIRFNFLNHFWFNKRIVMVRGRHRLRMPAENCFKLSKGREDHLLQ